MAGLVRPRPALVSHSLETFPRRCGWFRAKRDRNKLGSAFDLDTVFLLEIGKLHQLREFQDVPQIVVAADRTQSDGAGRARE